jgi:hypothetical protein
MNYFNIDIELTSEDKKWALEIGDNITEPNWTIRPYKLNNEEMHRVSYLTDQIGVAPSYAAIIMVPANSVCKTHVDDKADAAGIKQRITAINIPIQVHQESLFQYMEEEVAIETVKLDGAKCWRVDIPHRVDNSKSPFNRVVLSLSFVESVEDIQSAYLSRLAS